ncbi:MAG TPA: FAD:protein FMN transferase [Flavitalea sp.]|nr:FAD:protein FMN transferase [Flavitalea sp.]
MQVEGRRLFHHTQKMMGNRFSISIEHDSEKTANDIIKQAIDEVHRIETLFTTFSDASITNEINRNAGINPVEVPKEFLDLVQRANRISELTDGAFDLSFGSIDKRLWNFDTHMTSLPDKATASRMVRLINFRNIIVDPANQTVFLKQKGMRIGFGGIGKGYAADRARHLLKSLGVTCGIVNAAGDLTTWGNQSNGKRWTIGIAAPDQTKHPFSTLDITDMAVATSGDYEKFATINGKKYSHTINPKTGFPVSGIKSVTIICPFAELADAMATPVMVMGVNNGIGMINQVQGMHCIIIDEKDKLYTSSKINIK